MEDKIDLLFQQWNQFDSKVLVAEAIQTDAVDAEYLIAETTKYCRYSGRLTWILIDWIIRNIDMLNIEKLLLTTARNGDMTVLGLVSDLARQKRENEKLERIIRTSKPNAVKEVFFHRISRSKLATRIAIEQNLPIYDKWNFYCNELRYLTTESELRN